MTKNGDANVAQSRSNTARSIVKPQYLMGYYCFWSKIKKARFENQTMFPAKECRRQNSHLHTILRLRRCKIYDSAFVVLQYDKQAINTYLKYSTGTIPLNKIASPSKVVAISRVVQTSFGEGK